MLLSFSIVVIALGIAWVVFSWCMHRFSGWRSWEWRYTCSPHGVDYRIAAYVGMSSWIGYHGLILTSYTDHGIIVVPMWGLLFHRSICIPWGDIHGFVHQKRAWNMACTIRTQTGMIRFRGDAADIIARACRRYFVSEFSRFPL